MDGESGKDPAKALDACTPGFVPVVAALDRGVPAYETPLLPASATNTSTSGLQQNRMCFPWRKNN